PHARQRHLDAALLADDALVLHALVLAAQALVILDRPEDTRAEQAVTLRLERAVVDRLGLLDLAVGPGQNLLRARDRNADLVEHLRRHLRAEEIHHFLIHSVVSLAASAAQIIWQRISSPVPQHGETRSGALAAPLIVTRPPQPSAQCAP